MSTTLDTMVVWHEMVQAGCMDGLDELLAEDAVFESPVVYKPQHGKALASMYLTAAFEVLGNDSFRYVREIIGENDACLEFKVDVDGLEINGVDLISWGDDGRITNFKVMVRPLKGINLLHQKMAEMLQQFSRPQSDPGTAEALV